MALPEALPAHVRITARAERDLGNFIKRDWKNFLRVWQELKKLANQVLPQRPKKLKGFEPPIWQVDSGDFRIFFTWEGSILWVRGVLRKNEQKHRFKSMH